MTAEEHLRMLIGDLLVQIALLKSQIESLQGQLAATMPPPQAVPARSPE